MVADTWKNFDTTHIQSLANGPRFWDNPSERICPACGARCLRAYMETSARSGHPALINNIWCTSCHRFGGATGPKPTDLEFTDPLEQLSDDERLELQEDVGRFFGYLDRLWSKGALPQRFLKTPQL